MQILVPIKQVPFVDQLKFDRQAKRLIREGVQSEINPFDKRALTQAIQLKQPLDAQVVVLTMGPPQSKEALIEALAMGADRAVHLLGREFAGADTLATARALALACRKIGFDAIFCGKYATDAETAQVPPMLAEMLDVPQITGVTALKISDDRKTIVATRETDGGFETIESGFPVVLTAAERLVKPIKVAPATLEVGKAKPIQVMAPSDLTPDVNLLGLAGSPTLVSEIYSIEPTRKHIIRSANGNVDAVVQEVVRGLLAEGLFGEWKTKPHEIIRPRPRRKSPNDRTLWVMVELVGDEIRPVTLELLGRSVQLANDFDGQVAAVLIGQGVGKHARTLAAYGADQVYVADHPALATYSAESYTGVLAEAIRRQTPYAILFPSTSWGRDLAPRLAARLNIGLTGDCIGLEIDGEGRLVQLKPAFGGNIIAPILTRTRPAMATIRPGMFQLAQADFSREPVLQPLPIGKIDQPRTHVISIEENEKEGIALDDAEIIIGVGMGLGGPEQLAMIHDLAAVLKAPVGGTRRVVDSGWLPRQMQIGLTGRSISPRLYVAVGTSGKFNHTVGIQRSGLILAINNAPDSDIFKQADYGIIGDALQVVPALTRALALARQSNL